MEGKLKAEIIQDPAAYVSRDPEMAQTLLDQRQSGKPSLPSRAHSAASLSALLRSSSCMLFLMCRPSSRLPISRFSAAASATTISTARLPCRPLVRRQDAAADHQL